jgi:glycosyltransferase involved in cell wall biosynthesis
MRIAQVSPLFESVPPKTYGGTERVISYLTEELVAQGHDVTLFASGDSVTQARLISAVEHSFRQDTAKQSWLAYHTVQLDLLAQHAHEFDIIHYHTDYFHLPYAKVCPTPHVTTLHGRLDLPELNPLFRHFKDVPLVSVSDNQRLPIAWANWIDTVYHGLPHDLYPFQSRPGEYFLFVGRVSPEKRLDRAIEIAVRSGKQIYIGAKIDVADEAYFNETIRPLLQHPLVTFLGEIDEAEKRALLAHAAALLFPVDWPEPFGLVMIEAFACGTPVIAYPNGSVPEIMQDGVTGFIVDNQEAAVRAAARIDMVDRKICRDIFERRFTATRMADSYLRVYEKCIRSQACAIPSV